MVMAGMNLRNGTRVRYIGRTLRRGIEKGSETTILRRDANFTWGGMMYVVSATRNLQDVDEVRVWPAELEAI